VDHADEQPHGPAAFGAALENLARAIDEAILPESDRFTLEEAAERAGVDAATTRRLWRALGFADPRPGDRIAGQRDVDVLRLAMEQTLTPDGIENLVQQTRIMSAAVSRITELWVDQVRVSLDSGDPDLFTAVDAILWDQDRSMWMLGYMHRRLFAAGLRRELASRSSGSGTERCAVFADLVGFTTLTERLGPLELSRLIGNFEAIAYDTVAEHGGRVVKTIGDEVLFACDDPASALDTAADLMRRADAQGLPPLRAGADHGAAVWFEGDLFGTTVNRAARLVAEAPPGCIAAVERVRSACSARPWHPLGERHLKGVGDEQVFALDVVAG
jgi:adenylate cyclase